MKITFIGDIMLGRFVGEKYNSAKYDIVSPKIKKHISHSDYVIANLESPIIERATKREDHHLKFLANPEILEQFKWVNCFSLSNNHINDCGTIGMEQTMAALDRYKINWNGLYKHNYQPFLFENGQTKGAIITCDDLMNYEFADDCPWKTLRVGDDYIPNLIRKYRDLGYFVVLYAHVGMLFTRFPSPEIRAYLHKMADAGADLIISAHSHALGGFEKYKETLIFHSLGDFVMDGNSFRRRQACILDVEIEKNKLLKWDISPTQIDFNLQTVLPNKKTDKKLHKSFNYVSEMLAKHKVDYTKFYKNQYKKEMIAHSVSTLAFLIKTKGFFGMGKMIWVRVSDVLGMINRMLSDRSKMRYDSDLNMENGKYSNSKIK